MAASLKAQREASKLKAAADAAQQAQQAASVGVIANTVWPCVEVGHRVCCFTTTNTSADHLTSAITSMCPPESEDKLVVRLDIAAVEDLMIK